MDHIIDSVGDLTEQRDRVALEETLVSVTLELSRALSAVLWRTTRVDGAPRLQRRAFATANGRVLQPNNAGETLIPLAFQPDLYACFHSKRPVSAPTGADDEMCHIFPVTDGGEVVSMLELFYPGPLGEEQRRLVAGMLRIYRNHIGILDDSDCDELTGLLNRRTFGKTFARSVAAIAARKSPRAGNGAFLAVVDIDRFKSVNDHYGHVFGDEVLVLMAQLMRANFLLANQLFRFGGEEFLIVLD